jgi:hypothetical protein
MAMMPAPPPTLPTGITADLAAACETARDGGGVAALRRRRSPARPAGQEGPTFAATSPTRRDGEDHIPSQLGPQKERWISSRGLG